MARLLLCYKIVRGEAPVIYQEDMYMGIFNIWGNLHTAFLLQ